MNSRLQSLIDRGYSNEEVLNLATFTDSELEYASNHAFKHISRNCTPVDKPQAIFIGGQPGCGKTIMSMNLKNKINNAIEIGIENSLMYHPRYLEIEKCIKKHWAERKETINDTPGNDIADFTHLFAGAMTDKLIEMGMNQKYNLLLEWGMREPNGPLSTMKELKKQGYSNIVLFVATHKDISYQACNIRSDIQRNSNHIIRKVPKNFHDLCIKTLPNSVDEIYQQGYLDNLIDYMSIINRNNELLWDDKSNNLPGEVYKNYLNNYHLSNKKNDAKLATKTNSIEMLGLNHTQDELTEILGINPIIYEESRKTKI